MSSAPRSALQAFAPHDWIGRLDVTSDDVGLADIGRLAATLDSDRQLVKGDEVPPCWHWVLFQTRARQSELGPDGHPRSGDSLVPPVPLPRRMFLGIDVETKFPLRIGDNLQRTSKVVAITPKSGRRGELVFVTLKHDIVSSSGGHIVELHKFVFRSSELGSPDSRDATDQLTSDPSWEDALVVDPVLAFRYSACVFNAHRIHYDLPYATKLESYPDLLAPGRLIALLLLEGMRRRIPDAHISHFTFNAGKPIWVGEEIHLGAMAGDGAELELYARRGNGDVRMRATARVAS